MVPAQNVRSGCARVSESERARKLTVACESDIPCNAEREVVSRNNKNVISQKSMPFVWFGLEAFCVPRFDISSAECRHSERAVLSEGW